MTEGRGEECSMDSSHVRSVAALRGGGLAQGLWVPCVCGCTPCRYTDHHQEGIVPLSFWWLKQRIAWIVAVAAKDMKREYLRMSSLESGLLYCKFYPLKHTDAHSFEDAVFAVSGKFVVVVKIQTPYPTYNLLVQAPKRELA